MYYGSTENNNITLGSLLETDNSNSEKEYGYANKDGVVDASTLQEGDIINYYYDKSNEPITCVVLYNDASHGLQVVSQNSVRDVILGYDNNYQDPKSIEAFKNGVPSGYENTDFDKARWSYNHALQTLNGYAQDYLGSMAISARCVGTPADNIVLSEDETNMYMADESLEYLTDCNGKFKSKDNNVYENGVTSEIINEDIKRMESLHCFNIPNTISYWIASRDIFNSSYWTYGVGLQGYTAFELRCSSYRSSIGVAGEYLLEFYEGKTSRCYGLEKEFRVIFTLRTDMQIEKLGHMKYHFKDKSESYTHYISLYDENDKKIPILNSYNLQIDGESATVTENGEIVVRTI